MDILKNSYVMAILTFLSLYYIFYVMGIGYQTYYVEGKTVKDMSIKFPLLFAFGIWLLWHFVVFPHPNTLETHIPESSNGGPVIINKMWV
jgi:hypothetical protein